MSVASLVSSVRSRIIGFVARRYTGGSGGMSFSAGSLAMLPDSVLYPLFRDGLDPIARLGDMRENAPVSRLPVPFGIRVWLVTGYEPVRAVLGSTDGFSNDFGKLAGGLGLSAEQEPGGLGMADPPVHTRLRRLLTPEFTMRRLARLQPRIEEIVEGRLDAMAAIDGPVDLWNEYALPIPALTICDLLGVPYSDREYFQKLATARFDLGDGAYEALDAVTESLEYIGGLITEQRKKPGDGLIGGLIKAHGTDIGDKELAGLADGVLTGGLETSASMIALGSLILMTEQGLADDMRSGEGVDQIIEELLRYLTVVQVAFPRFAVRDMEIEGAQIRSGDVVICSLSAADRDPIFGETPDGVCPHRKAERSHLAFGHGIHRCVGAELAKMELRTAYPALVKRFPNMRPAVDPSTLPMRRASIVFGLDGLPVTLS